MNCDTGCDWGEEASIFFSYIEDNKVIKVNLCKYCANEKGVDDPTGYSLIDLMQGMGQETSSGKREQKSNELTCESCGFTQSDFKKTGRFGCANCYDVFNDGLESLLEAMHKNTEHAGKVPSFAAAEGADSGGKLLFETMENYPIEKIEEMSDEIVETDSSPEINLAMLKDKLDLAISEEDYEEAARIRDAITKIESGNVSN